MSASHLGRTVGVWLDRQPSLCPSQMFFGTPCPFCGGTRAVAYLVGGDLSTAVNRNAGAVLFFLVGVIAASWRIRDALRSVKLGISEG